MEAHPSGHGIACRALRTRRLWISRPTWRSMGGGERSGEKIEDLDQPVGLLEAWKSKMIAIFGGHLVQGLLSDGRDDHQDNEHQYDPANQNPDAEAITDKRLYVLGAS